MVDLLIAKQLSCHQGYKLLFEHLNFTLKPGDILRLTGDNGQGKTSLLRILAGLGQLESGHITLSGYDWGSENYRMQCFYLGHKVAIHLALSALDNLLFLVNLKQKCTINAAKAALDSVNLSGYYHTLGAQLSAGQCRRINLAALSLVTAPLWLLDEPFTALDKNGIIQLKSLISSHVARGGSCIFTSHQESDLAPNAVLSL